MAGLADVLTLLCGSTREEELAVWFTGGADIVGSVDLNGIHTNGLACQPQLV